MNVYVGLDVSLKETSVCIVEGEGVVLLERKVATEPDAIAAVLQGYRSTLRHIGLEACSLACWLHVELCQRDLPAVVIESKHTHVSLSTMRNKTDRNDARGIAQLMRLGWFKVVHVKSAEALRLRLLLGCRKSVVRKLVDTENEIRGNLRVLGLKVGQVSRGRFALRIRTLIADADSLVQELTLRLLAIRETLLVEQRRIHALVVQQSLADPVCRRLRTVPGVGPVAAVAFRAGVDDPARFKHSKTVGAHFGITPRQHQSGDVDYAGRISKCGDRDVRQALFDAAAALLRRCRKPSALRAWGLRIAKRRGLTKATVAVSRKMAVIMHRMWIDGTDFCWSKAQLAVTVGTTA